MVEKPPVLVEIVAPLMAEPVEAFVIVPEIVPVVANGISAMLTVVVPPAATVIFA